MAGGLFTAIYSGMIVAWSDTQTAPPTGWLLCDGGLKSKTDYPDLFSAVGHTFNGGVDPGGNQFKLPDFTDRYPRGVAASGSAASPGYYDGSSNHTHSFTTSFSVNAVTGSHAHNASVISGTNSAAYTDYAGGHAHTVNFGGNNAASVNTIQNNAKQTTPDASTAQSHTHPTANAVASNSSGSHSHNGSLGSINGNDHSHTVNVANSSHNLPVANDSASGSNDPKYHLVKYIIKT